MPKIKPWTAVFQHLEPLLEELHATRTLDTPGPVPSWIGGVTLLESFHCDTMCAGLHLLRPHMQVWPCGDVRLTASKDFDERQTERLALQLSIRMQFALDFCFADSSARRKAQWSGRLQSDIVLATIHQWRDRHFAWMISRWPPDGEPSRVQF